MSRHIYRINFLQWNTKGSKKGKKDKKGKISGFQVPGAAPVSLQILNIWLNFLSR